MGQQDVALYKSPLHSLTLTLAGRSPAEVAQVQDQIVDQFNLGPHSLRPSDRHLLELDLEYLSRTSLPDRKAWLIHKHHARAMYDLSNLSA